MVAREHASRARHGHPADTTTKGPPVYYAIRTDGTPVIPGDRIGSVQPAGGYPLVPVTFVRATSTRVTARRPGGADERFTPEMFACRIVGPDGYAWPPLTDGAVVAPVRHPNTDPDERYSVGREGTGDMDRQWVARFCGDRIGSAATEAGAWVLAAYHAMQRLYRIHGY